MANRTLRAGIIGCGRAALPGHVIPYLLHPQCRLAALCDRDEARAERLARKCGNPKIYTDAEEMFDRERLDVVSVCTPTFLHAEQTVAAAARGVHVMCEKPMSSGTEDGERMIRACEDAGVTLHVGYNKRFDAGILRVRDMVAEQKYGNCFQAEFKWYGLVTMGNVPAVRSAWKALEKLGVSREEFSPDWRFSDPRTPGGVMEVFCHIIDLALWMFGEPSEVTPGPRVVSADTGKPDHASALLSFPGGAGAYLSMSSRVLALWEKEEAVFHCDRANVRYETNSQRQALLPAHVGVEIDTGPLGLKRPLFLTPPIKRGFAATPHYRKIDDFVGDVLGALPSGESRVVCRGRDALMTDKLIATLIGKK